MGERAAHCPRIDTGFLACVLPALLLVALTGCATSDPSFSRIINEPATLPADVRASFGTVGVLPDNVAPELVLDYPPTPGEVMANRMVETFAFLEHSRREADRDHQASEPTRNVSQPQLPKPSKTSEKPGKGPAKSQSQHGAATHDQNGGDSIGDALGNEAGSLLFELLAAGAVAAVDAMLEGVSEKEARRTEQALRRALQEEPMQPGVQKCLYQFATGHKVNQLVPLTESQLAGFEPATGTNADYHSLAGTGIDSVLLVRIINQRFDLVGKYHSSMIFVAEADVRVIRVADGTVLHSGTLIYQSDARRFADWGANYARYFHAEMKFAEKLFAQTLMQELFDVDVGGTRMVL